tara:strand:+ start:1220 stop:1363 length:144 start_codon:yes stop_codon:yes gene_type:complete
MARRFKETSTFETQSKRKKTSIGKKPSTQMMNKHKRRQFKLYRGQGR